MLTANLTIKREKKEEESNARLLVFFSGVDLFEK